jgi:hypothetical protein
MRFITLFLIAIGMLILVIVLIFKGFSGGPKAPEVNLNSYANTSAVTQLLIDGPINADQTHQQVQISVGNQVNTFEVMSGYQGSVTATKSFASNPQSYSAFLQALQLAGFTKSNTTAVADMQGYCSTGQRYSFTLANGSNNVVRSWSSSCGVGTYKGNLARTLTLFEAQIPNYDQLTQNLFQGT